MSDGRMSDGGGAAKRTFGNMEFLRRVLNIFSFKKQQAIELTPEQEQARNKLEFFFSDSNLETDKFMNKKIAENPERYVPVSVIATFNTIRRLNLTEEQILQAARASTKLEVKDNMIRSVKEFQHDPRRGFRTIKVQGLNSDETLESLEEFFRAIFFQVPMIVMNRKRDENSQLVFTGTCFVELETEAVAQEAVERGIDYHGQKIFPSIVGDKKVERRGRKPLDKKQ